MAEQTRLHQVLIAGEAFRQQQAAATAVEVQTRSGAAYKVDPPIKVDFSFTDPFDSHRVHTVLSINTAMRLFDSNDDKECQIMFYNDATIQNNMHAYVMIHYPKKKRPQDIILTDLTFPIYKTKDGRTEQIVRYHEFDVRPFLRWVRNIENTYRKNNPQKKSWQFWKK